MRERRKQQEAKELEEIVELTQRFEEQSRVLMSSISHVAATENRDFTVTQEIPEHSAHSGSELCNHFTSFEVLTDKKKGGQSESQKKPIVTTKRPQNWDLEDGGIKLISH